MSPYLPCPGQHVRLKCTTMRLMIYSHSGHVSPLITSSKLALDLLTTPPHRRIRQVAPPQGGFEGCCLVCGGRLTTHFRASISCSIPRFECYQVLRTPRYSVILLYRTIQGLFSTLCGSQIVISHGNINRRATDLDITAFTPRLKYPLQNEPSSTSIAPPLRNRTV